LETGTLPNNEPITFTSNITKQEKEDHISLPQTC